MALLRPVFLRPSAMALPRARSTIDRFGPCAEAASAIASMVGRSAAASSPSPRAQRPPWCPTRKGWKTSFSAQERAQVCIQVSATCMIGASRPFIFKTIAQWSIPELDSRSARFETQYFRPDERPSPGSTRNTSSRMSVPQPSSKRGAVATRRGAT